MSDGTSGISEAAKQKLAAALGGSASETSRTQQTPGDGATNGRGTVAGGANGGRTQGATDSLESVVISIVEDATGIEREEITPKSTLDDDLNVDSLSLVDIAVRLEEEFNIEIEDEAIESVATIGKLVKLVDKRVKKAQEQ